MKITTLEEFQKAQGPAFITIIGRAGAGIPVERIEAIVEYDKNDKISDNIFETALKEDKLIKTLLDKDKIKSLIILDSGEVHPSTFHYITIKDRCSQYIPIVTFVGCDKAGINGNMINLLIDYKFDTIQDVTKELLEKRNVKILYEDADRTKCLMCMDSGTIYSSTFNYKTIRKRLTLTNKHEDATE